MEGEFSELSTNVIPYSDNQINKLSPEVWQNVKVKVATLLDDSVPHSCKKSIADQLCQLFERLERQPTTTDIAVANEHSEINIWDTNQTSKATQEFNDRLRSKIAEFNAGLAHLGNKIIRLKTRLLSWNNRSPTETDLLDIETCRNVNRNFRRILQKESRYLRDQLYAARETIQKLEKRSLDGKVYGDSNVTLLPYYKLKCRPTDFINIESGTAQLWLMSPIKSLQAVECLTPIARFPQSRSTLMKRSASPLEVVAGPDVKSGKFICSFNPATTERSTSSLVEWIPANQSNGKISDNLNTSNTKSGYYNIRSPSSQQENEQQNIILP